MIADYNKRIDIVKKFRSHDTDTGSTSLQIALLSERVKVLTRHFKTHKKDFSSRLGLMKIIEKRSKLLKYLKRNNEPIYRDLIASLNIRK